MPNKYDGVIEAVRYGPDGKIEMVRVYQRRGPTWSDRVLLNRKDLMRRIKAGKKYASGERVSYLAGTFRFDKPLSTTPGADGRDVLVTAGSPGDTDCLEGVPLF